MAFDIDIILGVQIELNSTTNLYELLFEVVLHCPLKYCRIFESDIARKTLAKHKMFTDICQELKIDQNIHQLRQNIMSRRISMLHLDIFRNSRIKQMKEKWTMVAHKIKLATTKKVGNKNMHKKMRTKRRYKCRRAKNNKHSKCFINDDDEYDDNYEYQQMQKVKHVKTKKTKKVGKHVLRKKSWNRKRKKQSDSAVEENNKLAETLKKRRKINGVSEMVEDMNIYIPGIKDFVEANVIARQQLNVIELNTNGNNQTMQQRVPTLEDVPHQKMEDIKQREVPSVNNSVPPCIVGIHLYNEPPNLAVYRKQFTFLFLYTYTNECLHAQKYAAMGCTIAANAITHAKQKQSEPIGCL